VLLLLVGMAFGLSFALLAQQPTPDPIQAAYGRRVQDEPNNPELFFEIATMYWDTAYRDAALGTALKGELVAKGLLSIDRALTLKPDYREAVVYKSLLLRLQATVETDPARQQALNREADELRAKADALDPLRR
jgi:hypothetical protein